MDSAPFIARLPAETLMQILSLLSDEEILGLPTWIIVKVGTDFWTIRHFLSHHVCFIIDSYLYQTAPGIRNADSIFYLRA